MARELKGIGSLKRNNKKDAKPSRVEILHRDDETSTLVYLFPRSVEITRNDGTVEFVAQIGRMFLRVYFNTQEMRLQDEPQLLMP